MLDINHIRKRPGMYIGPLCDGTCEFDGIYTMLRMVLNSLVYQFRAGFTDEIAITIQDDRSVTICYPSTDIKNIEIIQALSSSYEIEKDDRSMHLSFTPDDFFFKGFSYRQSIVSDILKSYCYANKGMTIKYNGKDIFSSNGLADLINDELRDELQYPIIHLMGPGIEISFSNRATASDAVYYSFVNGIKTDGGTHVNALKNSLVKVIGNITCDVDICPSQILDGLYAAISIDIVDPVYWDSNPRSLASAKVSPDGPEIRDVVCELLSTELPLYFKKNPETLRGLMSHFSKIAI